MCAYIIIVLIHLQLFNQHGIVGLQRILANPSLDGCAAPAVNNNALRHLVGLEHALTQEIAGSREQPGILLVHRFPVDVSMADILLYTMGAGFVLHTEQADFIILVVINLLSVLRINTLDGDIDVRLTREQPYISHQNIINRLIVDC